MKVHKTTYKAIGGLHKNTYFYGNSCNVTEGTKSFACEKNIVQQLPYTFDLYFKYDGVQYEMHIDGRGLDPRDYTMDDKKLASGTFGQIIPIDDVVFEVTVIFNASAKGKLEDQFDIFVSVLPNNDNEDEYMFNVTNFSVKEITTDYSTTNGLVTNDELESFKTLEKDYNKTALHILHFAAKVLCDALMFNGNQPLTAKDIPALNEFTLNMHTKLAYVTSIVMDERRGIMIHLKFTDKTAFVPITSIPTSELINLVYCIVD